MPSSPSPSCRTLIAPCDWTGPWQAGSHCTGTTHYSAAANLVLKHMPIAAIFGQHPLREHWFAVPEPSVMEVWGVVRGRTGRPAMSSREKSSRWSWSEGGSKATIPPWNVKCCYLVNSLSQVPIFRTMQGSVSALSWSHWSIRMQHSNRSIFTKCNRYWMGRDSKQLY